jgi:hypothetical protein
MARLSSRKASANESKTAKQSVTLELTHAHRVAVKTLTAGASIRIAHTSIAALLTPASTIAAQRLVESADPVASQIRLIAGHVAAARTVVVAAGRGRLTAATDAAKAGVAGTSRRATRLPTPAARRRCLAGSPKAGESRIAHAPRAAGLSAASAGRAAGAGRQITIEARIAGGVVRARVPILTAVRISDGARVGRCIARQSLAAGRASATVAAVGAATCTHDVSAARNTPIGTADYIGRIKAGSTRCAARSAIQSANGLIAKLYPYVSAIGIIRRRTMLEAD